MKNEFKTEKEMREGTVPVPPTIEELTEYIQSLVEREHDYGTAVYAMSMAAVAAFNYVAHKESVTGFQASCADMDIIRRTRNLTCPFMFIKGDDMLYPQYSIHANVSRALTEWADWAANEAEKKLNDSTGVCESVINHWKKLAATKKTNSDGCDSQS